jgi:hypothetical protein
MRRECAMKVETSMLRGDGGQWRNELEDRDNFMMSNWMICTVK